MARRVAIAMVIILAAVAASAGAEDYYLYKPQKVQSGDIPAPGDGVLTRTITIQRGDTLSKLSRRYNGRSSFFSQILLFNKIRNPDLIYAGDTLRVPLTRAEGAAKAGETPREAGNAKEARPGRAMEHATKRHHHQTRPARAMAGKQLFSRGMRAYAKGRYREAIDIFDRYLAAYPNSADAPEAALYKAECYMRLSGGR
jgi:TolA-binding protein